MLVPSGLRSGLPSGLPSHFAIEKTQITPATVLAPMAGVTDTIFRRLIRQQGGCGLIMTEFTSSHGVVASLRRKKPSKTEKRYLSFEPEEHPISAQLFGSDPEIMADAARHCEDLGFDFVDINFGCPVKKVVKCNGGSGCLRDLPLVDRILKAVRGAIRIPLTMKFRTGWNDNELVFLQMGKMAEDNGLAAIAMHGRTREQGYAGHANWDHIAELKANVKLPVIGNGDIVTPEDALRMFEHTKCDAVMIGRAASYNPWIFRQISEYVSQGSYWQPTQEDRFQIMKQYFEMLTEADWPEAVGKMKQFTGYFTHGVRNGSRLRALIYKQQDARQIIGEVERFFEEELAAVAA